MVYYFPKADGAVTDSQPVVIDVDVDNGQAWLHRRWEYGYGLIPFGWLRMSNTPAF